MIKFICPLIVVEDIARSRQFYEGCLGQKVKFDFGVDLQFMSNFSLHQKDHYQTLLGDEKHFPIVSKSNASELYFEAEDLEAVQGELKNAGVEFIHEIHEEPWGQLTMRLYDPDGHIIDIGEAIETTVIRMHQQGSSNDFINQKTGLPHEFIEQVLKTS